MRQLLTMLHVVSVMGGNQLFGPKHVWPELTWLATGVESKLIGFRTHGLVGPESFWQRAHRVEQPRW